MDTEELLDALAAAEKAGRPLEYEGHRFTSLDRIMWPRQRYTKGDLVRYYVRVAEVLLRYLEGRPLLLKRYHGTIQARPIFQQRAGANTPGRVRTAEITPAEGERTRRFIGSLPTLLYAVQMNAVELHPWLSRVDAQERPDWVVLDLDPSEGAGFKKVVHVALALRAEVQAVGLDAYVKSSGSRGLHLYVPTGGGAAYEDAAELARLLAERVAAAEPAYATVQRSLEERGYQVYIDHLQNARGKTAVSPYSVRAREGAPVSAPVSWDEVGADLDPRQFGMKEMPDRLREAGDLWAGLFEPAGEIGRALERLREQGRPAGGNR